MLRCLQIPDYVRTDLEGKYMDEVIKKRIRKHRIRNKRKSAHRKISRRRRRRSNNWIPTNSK